jgi:hypothetical protein
MAVRKIATPTTNIDHPRVQVSLPRYRKDLEGTQTSSKKRLDGPLETGVPVHDLLP